MEEYDEIGLLTRIARHYYLDNMLQSEIAKKEGISRPQVSRLLKRAKELGIVEIRINQLMTNYESELAAVLKKQLQLKDVVILSSLEGDDNDVFCSEAAAYLSEHLINYRYIGVGGGMTILKAVESLPMTDNQQELVFVPLVSNPDAISRHLQTSIITDNMAMRFQNARTIYLNQPLYRLPEYPVTDMLQNIFSLWHRLDAAVISVGAPPNETTDTSRYMEELRFYQVEELNPDSMIGNILWRFIFQDGSVFTSPSNTKITAIALETLAKTPNVICLATGRSKIGILRYAADKKYIHTLLTDVSTAKALLESL